MGLNLNYTRFHGEYPVKAFLKMWGVMEEDISEPLRTFTEKAGPPSQVKKQALLTDKPEERAHHETEPGKGAGVEDIT